MSRLLGFLLLMIICLGPADACDCLYDHLNDAKVKASKAVFVFQLKSASISSVGSEHGDTNNLSGVSEVVESFRGAYRSTALTYSNHMCCGIRMEVGHFYAAFAKDLDEPFKVDLGSVMDLGAYYSPGDGLSKRIRLVVNGVQTFESTFGEFPNRNLYIVPIPPPPCKEPPVTE